MCHVLLCHRVSYWLTSCARRKVHWRRFRQKKEFLGFSVFFSFQGKTRFVIFSWNSGSVRKIVEFLNFWVLVFRFEFANPLKSPLPARDEFLIALPAHSRRDRAEPLLPRSTVILRKNWSQNIFSGWIKSLNSISWSISGTRCPGFSFISSFIEVLLFMSKIGMDLLEGGLTVSLTFADKDAFKDFYYRSSR